MLTNLWWLEHNSQYKLCMLLLRLVKASENVYNGGAECSVRVHAVSTSIYFTVLRVVTSETQMSGLDFKNLKAFWVAAKTMELRKKVVLLVKFLAAVEGSAVCGTREKNDLILI